MPVAEATSNRSIFYSSILSLIYCVRVLGFCYVFVRKIFGKGEILVLGF